LSAVGSWNFKDNQILQFIADFDKKKKKGYLLTFKGYSRSTNDDELLTIHEINYSAPHKMAPTQQSTITIDRKCNIKNLDNLANNSLITRNNYLYSLNGESQNVIIVDMQKGQAKLTIFKNMLPCKGSFYGLWLDKNNNNNNMNQTKEMNNMNVLITRGYLRKEWPQTDIDDHALPPKYFIPLIAAYFMWCRMLIMCGRVETMWNGWDSDKIRKRLLCFRKSWILQFNG